MFKEIYNKRRTRTIEVKTGTTYELSKMPDELGKNIALKEEYLQDNDGDNNSKLYKINGLKEFC